MTRADWFKIGITICLLIPVAVLWFRIMRETRKRSPDPMPGKVTPSEPWPRQRTPEEVERDFAAALAGPFDQLRIGVPHESPPGMGGPGRRAMAAERTKRATAPRCFECGTPYWCSHKPECRHGRTR